MGFDGAGRPYRSGPSWRTAILVIVAIVVALLLAWGAVSLLFSD